MEHATITLQGSLSHTVRLSNKPEIKFIKGRPLMTSDDALIRYAKANPAFAVTLNVVQREAPAARERPSTPPAPVVGQRTGQGRFIKKSPMVKPSGSGTAEGSGE